MSKVDELTDGRIALAKNDIGLALSDLGALRARVASRDIGEDGWQMNVDMAFAEIDCLLSEALQALA